MLYISCSNSTTKYSGKKPVLKYIIVCVFEKKKRLKLWAKLGITGPKSTFRKYVIILNSKFRKFWFYWCICLYFTRCICYYIDRSQFSFHYSEARKTRILVPVEYRRKLNYISVVIIMYIDWSLDTNIRRSSAYLIGILYGK